MSNGAVSAGSASRSQLRGLGLAAVGGVVGLLGLEHAAGGVGDGEGELCMMGCMVQTCLLSQNDGNPDFIIHCKHIIMLLFQNIFV